MAKSSSFSAWLLLILVALCCVWPSSGTSRQFEPSSRHLLETETEKCIPVPVENPVPDSCKSNSECCRSKIFIPTRTSTGNYTWDIREAEGACNDGVCCSPYGALCYKDSDCCPGPPPRRTQLACLEGRAKFGIEFERFCGSKDM